MLKALKREELSLVMERIDTKKIGTTTKSELMCWMLTANYDEDAEFPGGALMTPIIGGAKLHVLWNGPALQFVLEGTAAQMIELQLNPA